MSAKKASKKSTAVNTPAPAATTTPVTPAPAQETNLGASVTPQVPAATNTPAATPATTKLPFGGKQAPAFKTLGPRDAFGFGQDTETSWLLARLAEGTYTKQTLLDAFIKKFVKEGDKADANRKKTSFSVFFSDVRKPFGTYHASRSLEIVADATTGVLSLEPTSVERCKKAITAKVLDDLRGLTLKKHREKILVVLKKHNLPLPEETK